MYPVPQFAQQIETQWSIELGLHFGQPSDRVLERDRPWFDFPDGQLRIELMDGSAVQFKHAFHIVNEAKCAIAVFTEHCGHHVFPYHDARIYRDETLVYAQSM